MVAAFTKVVTPCLWAYRESSYIYQYVHRQNLPIWSLGSRAVAAEAVDNPSSPCIPKEQPYPPTLSFLVRCPLAIVSITVASPSSGTKWNGRPHVIRHQMGLRDEASALPWHAPCAAHARFVAMAPYNGRKSHAHTANAWASSARC